MEQQWQVQSLGTGYYTIANRNSGLVAGSPGNLWDGGAVTQWPLLNSALDQEWSLEPSETSGSTQYYKLQENSDSRVMGISGGSTSPGTWAIGWDDIYQGPNGSNRPDQEFSFVPVAGIPNGTYILTAHNSGLVLDDPGYSGSGAALDQWGGSGINSGTNQQWKITSNGAGYFTLTCVANNLAAGVSSSTTEGTSLVLEPVTGADDQLWSIQPYDGSYYHLIDKLTGYAADVYGAGNSYGTDIDQWPLTGGWNQEWMLTPL